MFNSVVLDVVIGLVLIYLLYSLLVSIIGEMLSSRMRIRAKMLKNTIASMLMDDNEEKSIKIWHEKLRHRILWIKRSWHDFFSYTRPDFKYSLAEKFYNYPSIKYLGKNEFKNLPSYISKENFSDTLFNMLREKGTGTDDMVKIDFCLKYNTLNIDNETKKHITNLFKTADNNPDIFKASLRNWFDETMDRLNGWYKRRLQFILFWFGFIIAISFNVDTIKIVKQLSKDKDARNQLVQMGIQLSKDPLRYKEFVSVSKDSLHSQAIIDSAYAHVTKDINEANMALGLGWKFDSLRKTKTILVPNSKPDSVIIHKFDSIKANIDINNKLLIKNKNLISSYTNSFDSLKTELKYSLDDKRTSIINVSINHIRERIQNCLQAINNSTIINLRNEAHIKDLTTRLNINYKTAFIKVDEIEANNKYDSLEIKGYIASGFGSKVCYFLNNTVIPWKSPFWGFIITALMLSLGAPFWFDLLKKLVSIRSSGVKPEEKKVSSTKDSPVPLKDINNIQLAAIVPAISPSQLAKAVQELKDETVNLFGVITIREGFIKTNNVKQKAIEVHVKDLQTKNDFIAKFGSTFQNFLINYLLNSDAKSHNILAGQTILNKEGINGLGTLGCFVQKAVTNQVCLLSCWHVLKEDSNWNVKPIRDLITGSDNKVIARIIDGAITNNFDVGFAELTVKESVNNKSININFSWRQVTSEDELNETPVAFLGATSSNPKNATIYQKNVKASLKYPDGNYYELEDLTAITAYDTDGNPIGPSSHGDSGAVVVDQEGYPVGIIVGGDDLYSYVVKFSNIISEDSIYSEYKIII